MEKVGLFVTSINAPDNIRNIIGNGKILGDIIQDFSTNAETVSGVSCRLNSLTERPDQAIVY